MGGGCVVDGGLIWVCWWIDLGFPDTVQDLLGLVGILMGLLGMFNGFVGYVLLGRYEDGRWKEKENKVKSKGMEES